MEILRIQGGEQDRTHAGCVRDKGSWVRRTRAESIHEVLGPQGGDVAEQDCCRAGAQHPLDVRDPLTNGGVEAITVVGYDGAALIVHKGGSELVGGHDDQLGRRHTRDRCADRVQGERMRQIGPRHPIGWMQATLGGRLALDRDDQSPAVDVWGAHLDDRVRTGVLVSTPTLSCSEDDGQPGRNRGRWPSRTP
jgi:hypothetical protein